MNKTVVSNIVFGKGVRLKPAIPKLDFYPPIPNHKCDNNNLDSITMNN